MELTLRKERVLASVIQGYIQGGEPVGSKVIAEEIGVSSATVRNEMASLTELGTASYFGRAGSFPKRISGVCGPVDAGAGAGCLGKALDRFPFGARYV